MLTNKLQNIGYYAENLKKGKFVKKLIIGEKRKSIASQDMFDKIKIDLIK